MQVIIMKYSLVLTLFLISPLFCLSQKQAITDDGDTVILHKDGTWSAKQNLSEANLILTNWQPLSSINVLIEKENIDPYKGTKEVITKSWINFAKTETGAILLGNAISTQQTVGFNFAVMEDLGCLSKENSMVMVKLENGDIIEMAQVSETNCAPSQSAIFMPVSHEEIDSPDFEKIMRKNLNKLASNNWVSMRIYGTKYEADVEPIVSEKYNGAQFFREHLQAVGFDPRR